MSLHAIVERVSKDEVEALKRLLRNKKGTDKILALFCDEMLKITYLFEQRFRGRVQRCSLIVFRIFGRIGGEQKRSGYYRNSIRYVP